MLLEAVGLRPRSALVIPHCSRLQSQLIVVLCACRELVTEGQQVDSLYAGKGETARLLTMTNFRAGRCWTLVATDLIGRGVDFVDVATVRPGFVVLALVV